MSDARPAEATGLGLALECATSHVEALVVDPHGEPLAHVVEDVGHGHTRRLVGIVRDTLGRCGATPASLGWIAADLGPGSFTGVRVGLATAHALALAAGAEVLGASSLAALALGSGARRSIVVPLVPAGRRDLYAGFYRADTRGTVHLLAGPRVGTPAQLLEAVAEARTAAGGAATRDPDVRFVGPGAEREREVLEAAWPGSTSPAWRFEGLSAHDLAAAVRSGRGPAAGLPARGAPPSPQYVRSAQAEERVRHSVSPSDAIRLRDFLETDVPQVVLIESRVFPDAWPEGAFRSELRMPWAWARIAERDGRLAGYIVAMFGEGAGHVGNIAVAPESRRRGVARALLDELIAHARAVGIDRIGLEVRVSNFEAQALYRSLGFRLAGLRHRYYRDTGEDALIMAWFDPARGAGATAQDLASVRRAGAGPSGTI